MFDNTTVAFARASPHKIPESHEPTIEFYDIRSQARMHAHTHSLTHTFTHPLTRIHSHRMGSYQMGAPLKFQEGERVKGRTRNMFVEIKIE